MKPSEALDTIGVLASETALAERRACGMRDDLSRLLADLDAGHPLTDLGERARHLLGMDRDDVPADDLAPFAGIVTEAQFRKDGKPKQRPGRKPKADPSTSTKAERPSPLTPDLRAKFEATLGAGPMTLDGIKRMSWTAELDVEALLCEDPAAFVSWIDPSSLTQARVWGLAEQFDHAVVSLDLQCSKAGRASYVAQELGCSLAAATEAWYRIDMGAS